MTRGSGAGSVEGTSRGSKSKRKTDAQDERQQRVREATTLQLSELLSGMGRMHQPMPMPLAAGFNRPLTDESRRRIRAESNQCRCRAIKQHCCQ